MLGEERVAAADKILTDAKGKGKRPYRGKVPEVAIQGCKESHRAANSEEDDSEDSRFDDRGLMALVCRHDIPICFVNITSKGEGQKYVLACLIWLFEQLPLNATIAILYDIGCVVDRSRQLVSTTRSTRYEFKTECWRSMTSCLSR